MPVVQNCSMGCKLETQMLRRTKRKLIESMNSRFPHHFTNLMHNGLHRLRLTASKYFPRLFRRPFPREMLGDITQGDSKRNAENSPPEDEFIELCSVWAIEFYTPAHMDDLLNNLERLDWPDDESRDPVSWLRQRGVSQFGQAWKPLGLIFPRDARGPSLNSPIRADLPPNVQFAYGDILWFTPSLIAIALEFTFDEKYSRIYDDALRQYKSSFLTATSRGYRIHDPRSQRTSHIEKIRQDTTRHVTDWFSSNLPGLCSAGLLDGEMPTCEFVTLRAANPFPTREEDNSGIVWYLWHLGLSNFHGSWESASMPALRFYPSFDRRYGVKFHSILSINEGSWLSHDGGDDDRNDKWSRIYEMHLRMAGILGLWSVSVLLKGYAEHFRKLRNSRFLRSVRNNSAVNALQSISESVSFSVDIAAVTAELASYEGLKRPLWFEIESFVPRPDESEHLRESDLESLIQRQIIEDANWLRSIDNVVRDHLTQYGTMLGMVEDIHLQNKVTRLTYAMLALTIVLSILTFITVLEKLPWVHSMWKAVAEFFQGLWFS